MSSESGQVRLQAVVKIIGFNGLIFVPLAVGSFQEVLPVLHLTGNFFLPGAVASFAQLITGERSKDLLPAALVSCWGAVKLEGGWFYNQPPTQGDFIALALGTSLFAGLEEAARTLAASEHWTAIKEHLGI